MQVLDSTLREGELFQVFPRDVRVSIASSLAKAGVRRAELTVDYPPRTTAEEIRPVVQALTDGGVEVVMHGRANPDDVEAITKYNVAGCALYIAVSKLHRDFKLHGITEEEALDRLCAGVELCRGRGFRYIRATLEDASRLYLEESADYPSILQRAIVRLKDSGATLVSLPDTSGLMTPQMSADFFGKIKGLSPLPAAAHFHNDYGLASANTVEAGVAGAEELHVTLMGIGDRNGIADLYEVVATLEDVRGIDTKIDRSSLRETYEYFSRITGIELAWRHPLSNAARTIRAGVHQSMTVKRKEGYIPLKKLVNDFGEPLYAISPYVSHNLMQAILAPYGDRLGPESSKKLAERLAVAVQGGKASLSLERVKEIIKEETGIEVSDQELSRFFGGEKVYLLLKLRPQYPAENIVKEVAGWEGVETVDEVYGDADMIVRARTRPGKTNIVSLIRQTFSEELQDLKVFVTD